MAPADADARRELRTIRAMPYGSARTAAAEVIVRRIDAEGPQERLAEALLDLVEAYSFTGQGHRSFVTFARLLRLWDSQPELFDESDEHNLFWEFKWVAGDLPDYPEITREQADAFLEDMRRRFALVGKGLGSVFGSRFRWEWHSGDAGMEQARLAWLALPKDDMDSCAACRIGHQVDYFTETGRFAEAIALGLTQHSSCNLEPTRTLHALALAHLNAGDATSALAAYRRAVATLDTSDSDYAPARGQGFETVARGGHIERALRFLREDHAELLEGASTPLFRLRFLLGVLAGLSANLDRGELPTGLRSPDAPTLAQLHAWVHDQAADLASRFDARGGGDYYARLLARSLTATRTPVALDFDLAALTPPTSPPPAAEAQPGSGVELDGARDVAATPTGPAAVAAALRTAERRARARAFPAAAAAYLQAAEVATAAGLLEHAGMAWAESAQCAARAGDEQTAHTRYAAALPLLRAADGDPSAIAQVLAAWAPIAAGFNDTEALMTHLEVLLGQGTDGGAARSAAVTSGEADHAGMDADLTERQRRQSERVHASLLETWARVVATIGSRGAEAADAAAAAGEMFAHAGQIGAAAHAFWLAGQIHRENGDLAGAVLSLESAYEGLTIARDSSNRARAASELIDVLRATGQHDRADAVIGTLTSAT